MCQEYNLSTKIDRTYVQHNTPITLIFSHTEFGDAYFMNIATYSQQYLGRMLTLLTL